jgi:hypothetical protein
VEDGVTAFHKTTHSPTRASHTPESQPRQAEKLPHENLHVDVYSSFIHRGPNVEGPKKSFGG